MSTESPMDMIEITFWGQPLFFNWTSRFIEIGYKTNSFIPDPPTGKKIMATSQTISSTILSIITILLIADYFLNFGIGDMIASIKKL